MRSRTLFVYKLMESSSMSIEQEKFIEMESEID